MESPPTVIIKVFTGIATQSAAVWYNGNMKIRVCDNRTEDAACDVTLVRGGAILPALDTETFCGPGTAITPLYECDGYLCVSAVTRDGAVTQRAFSLNANYGYRPGDTLEPFTAGGTRCAITVDVDALRPEPYRVMALRGVQVVFCVRWIEPARYNEDFVLFGPWSNAQANNLFVVDVNNVETNVICPCALSGDGTGFLARGRTDDFCIELPTERFYEGQRSFPVFQSYHEELYRAYFGRETT